MPTRLGTIGSTRRRSNCRTRAANQETATGAGIAILDRRGARIPGVLRVRPAGAWVEPDDLRLRGPISGASWTTCGRMATPRSVRFCLRPYAGSRRATPVRKPTAPHRDHSSRTRCHGPTCPVQLWRRVVPVPGLDRVWIHASWRWGTGGKRLRTRAAWSDRRSDTQRDLVHGQPRTTMAERTVEQCHDSARTCVRPAQ